MSTYPFYSPSIREALMNIISHENEYCNRGNSSAPSSSSAAAALSSRLAASSLADDDDDDYHFLPTVDGTDGSGVSGVVQPGTVIRGKWRGAYSSSSDDDDDNNNDNEEEDNNDDENNDGQSSSASAASSLAPLQEEEGLSDQSDSDGEWNATQTQQVQQQQPQSQQQQQQQQQIKQGKSKKSTMKKSKHKKTKEDFLKKLGSPPSILLPLPSDEDASANNNDNNHRKNKKHQPTMKTALQIPSVLLPPQYLRENPNYHVPTVAKTLLTQWDSLTGANSNAEASPKTILVVLLQSGRFASAVLSLSSSSNNNNNLNNNNNNTLKLLSHKTSTRYTIRKGQGGSQSSHDQSKGKAKSIGSQLRREGEKQLRIDVTTTWKEWKKMGYVQNAQWIYVSCPKGMRREYLFGGGEDDSNHHGGGGSLVEKGDGRLRNIPLDVGRPTLEGALAVVDCLLGCCVRELTGEEKRCFDGENGEEEEVKEKTGDVLSGNNSQTKNKKKSNDDGNNATKAIKVEEPALPLTPLHEAVIAGDLSQITDLIDQLPTIEDYDINTLGGPDLQTPLHYASSSTHPEAPTILETLLLKGHADPCITDTRGRPPYFLASSDKIRETFRLARSTLGESYCSWDEDAKVGPSLTLEDIQSKKSKALEKKRKQRARQKEKKAQEKAEADREEQLKREEEEKKKAEEDSKRVRAGLKPKSSNATNVCDFCQVVVRGKKRSQMFQRLDYVYCSTECVKKHQRELMAAAAAARMGG